MSANTFQLLSEDYTDEEFLELFGSEYLTLDSEYQASIQQMAAIKSPVEQKKEQARYERESAAKLTRYSLTPTFTMPSTVRAIPTTLDVLSTTTSLSSIETPPVEHVTKISNKKLKREQYRLARQEIRRQRRPGNGASSSATTSIQE
ncbi:unnamed protein product [Macrosiphum euphorbiae]|uniref:Uncharacterized protein n=1 Tax=Macrosiphum euphorbiae TaxID=13131 RepID=A0AAV0VSB6_9HEMI|nr:unnamed protein product [Macrosiphum euphorbiae]CAI6344039.1 unnamed protein product [Macrosiphum euphorbiae]CAI6345331.1 unnamed protein product [Macrosiphum euphorbiae]CAI6347187.1 unnamed protein product [Macrosiphum euphorbiae]CAI6348341.1 unnamed protein product [Macrosiphum euphorbiae]